MTLNGGAPLDGMIVFNTNFNDGLGGLCIWHHSKWNRLLDYKLDVNDGNKTDYIELRQTTNQNLSPGDNILKWHAITRAQYEDGYVPPINNTGDILIRRAGVYSVTVRVNVATFTAVPVNHRYLFISKNGTQIAASGFNHGASNPLLTVSTMIYCNQNDILNIGYFTTLSNAFTNIVDNLSVNCFVAEISPFTFE
ncbi:MAG: hypothetical protein EOO42_19030 [Flavobacteriales bacterium]|nr:MAG: hypothetical protein EOO42_19030 [Flavobacteriales bacterium]